MARPRKARILESFPAPVIYIPTGWTKKQPAPVEVAIEDFEIMRLVDGHHFAIEEAAQRVGVSRSTAGRMLTRVRRILALGIEKRAPMYLDASEELVLEPPSVGAISYSRGATGLADGRLAVACVDTNLDSPIERIFGRAAIFLVISEDGMSQIHFPNPGAGLKRKAADAAVKSLKAQGASRIVAGRFGPEAIKALASEGIQAIIASGFTVRQSIELFNGKPQKVSNEI